MCEISQNPSPLVPLDHTWQHEVGGREGVVLESDESEFEVWLHHILALLNSLNIFATSFSYLQGEDENICLILLLMVNAHD